MLRRLTSYVLISLIALQSAVATADAHLLHESGNDHVAVELSLGDTHHDGAEHSSNDRDHESHAESASDCQHCCHCHGAGHIFLNAKSNAFIALNNGSGPDDYLFSYLPHHESPDNPPPIG